MLVASLVTEGMDRLGQESSPHGHTIAVLPSRCIVSSQRYLCFVGARDNLRELK